MNLKKCMWAAFGGLLIVASEASNLFALGSRPNSNPNAPPPPAWVQFFPIVVMVLVFYMLLIRPQLKQKKDLQKMLGDLKKGDKVVVQGGFVVTITNILPSVFEVKLNDETKAKILRTAVTELYIEPTETNNSANIGGITQQ